MERKSFIAVLFKCFVIVAAAFTEVQVILKTCAPDNLLNCPNYSLCTELNNENNYAVLRCVCIENYQLNSNWLEYENLNNSLLLQEHYCISSNKTATAEENKLIVYMRSPARREHLVFGILMVLLAAILATAVLYGLKLLRPLKRTKSVYQKLKNKRKNIERLQEMDELELNRCNEMQTL